ncbi:hypothetical protein QBC46DRAFT_314834 [Diplogelasinospora grovesii]|uniref:TM7S3/TM198-like domain-containing protein n=1 Tax=Diplogelasinospora grovesii TaxID=303347 RepID=A0AAN6N6C6_9PEZI|nr:hypothetical protein QBC46DRAFT_314834 [Diplogelasinospora grovesii]
MKLFARPSRTAWAHLLCLCLFTSSLVVAAGPLRLERLKRDETTISASPTTTARNAAQETTTSPTPSTIPSDAANANSTAVSSTASISASNTAIAAPSATSSLNTTLLNTTIPEGELPIEPIVTPGWAVAGVVLLISGVVHALVGIRTRWLHTFLSVAFLAGLGVSVLIVYVMNPPVSNAVQGAYVVAVVCTGLILGGLAVLFKEITECLGCLLGGFCISMWLLTLQEGGLVPNSTGKILFIAAFSLVGLGLYFSHWTRTYSLIGSISFSGATAAVLGIDCFSRAGLKEFWAYIWQLNDKIFPLGADTYPLTRGIRVELAATILICAAGIVSLLRLWRVIKERRDRKDAERAEGERHLRAEDEKVGRQIEEANIRERALWERTYGDGTTSQLGDSADSGVGDTESQSEKRVMRHSTTGTATTDTRSPSLAEADEGRGIEMVHLQSASDDGKASPSFPLPSPLSSRYGKDGMVAVRIGQDDEDAAPEHEGQEQWGVVGDGRERRPSSQSTIPNTTSPTIIPLPFKIPEGVDDEEDNDGKDEDRSSAATVADEEDDEQRETTIARTRDGKAYNLAKRLSSGSAKLLRSLSQRSGRGKMEAKEAPGESLEQLVWAAKEDKGTRDDSDSVAANLDDMSYNGDDIDALSLNDREGRSPREIEITAELGEKAEETARDAADNRKSSSTQKTAVVDTDNDRKEPSAASPRDEAPAASAKESNSERANDRRTSIDSSVTAASLVKENLPPALSRVALSYRTNEWAKHLGDAEAPPSPPRPEPEVLIGQVPKDESQGKTIQRAILTEEPAPLDVVDLQQTAETATPKPAAPRSESRSASAMSNYWVAPQQQQQKPAVSRSGSRTSIAASPTPEPGMRSASGPPLTHQNKPLRLMSGGTLKGGRTSMPFVVHEPIAEESGSDIYKVRHRRRSGGNNPTAVPQEGIPISTTPSPVPFSSSSSPNLLMMGRPSVSAMASSASLAQPQTLIGKREMFLRNKSQGSFAVLPTAPTPDPVMAYAANGANSTPNSRRNSSEAGSMHNYPMYAAAAASGTIDADDLPLSQRRALIRQGSINSIASNSKEQGRLGSGAYNTSTTPVPVLPTITADSTGYNSHQPQRRSSAVPEAVRQAQLANFRSSVAADLQRNATASPSPIVGTPAMFASTGRETPMLGMRSHEVMNLDTQRNFLMGQKEAEAQRREQERIEKELVQREFEERMRASPALMEAHRDAMRRMQRQSRAT